MEVSATTRKAMDKEHEEWLQNRSIVPDWNPYFAGAKHDIRRIAAGMALCFFKNMKFEGKFYNEPDRRFISTKFAYTEDDYRI